MDIGLSFSGFVRGPSDWCFETISKEFLKNKCSQVYSHAYSSEDINRLISMYNPRRLIVNSVDDPIDLPEHYFTFPETRARNVFLMWRNVYLSNLLIDESCPYVARLRYDNGFVNGSFEALRKSLLGLGKGLIIPKGGDNRGGIFDMFAIGDFSSMRIYSNLYLHINDYIRDGLPVHSELLLRHHLKLHNVNVHRIDLPVGLIRSNQSDFIYTANTKIPGSPEVLGRRFISDKL